MTVGSAARRTAFWALDAVRGKPIRGHLEDIRSSMDGTTEAPERLEALLDHARRTTPFYTDVESSRLDAFPILTRPVLQRQPEALHSNAYANATFREVTTSGSTGRPVTVRQDQGKRLRSIADIIYMNEICGLLVGDPLLWMRAWGEETNRAGLVRRAQNITTFEVRGLDEERMQRVVDTIRHGSMAALLAYPSALRAIARFVDDRDVDARAFGLRVVFSDSESLSSQLRDELETTFGCPVADRYANEENGMLAIVEPGADAFRLNRASYVFEFLGLDDDSPQRAGELARVIITDLFNFAMPLIRYDTGDLAVVPKHSGPSPTTIERLEGRRLDVVLDMAGRAVSSTMLATAMDPFEQLQQYQLRQLDTHAFRLLFVDAEDVYTAEQLEGALVVLLGHGTDITVERVTDIPAEANGKFRVMVPLGRAPEFDN